MEGENPSALGERVVRCRPEVVTDRVNGKHLPEPDIVRQPPRIHRDDETLFSARQATVLGKLRESLDDFLRPTGGHGRTGRNDVATLILPLRSIEGILRAIDIEDVLFQTREVIEPLIAV